MLYLLARSMATWHMIDEEGFGRRYPAFMFLFAFLAIFETCRPCCALL